MIDIAIIGAGLSGLIAANVLKRWANITVFEKSNGVGGRMATRRADPYAFDHGAQFFTAKTDDFKTFITPMIKKDVIKCWHARFVQFENRQVIVRHNWDENYPHYVGAPSMNVIAKYLSLDVTVNLNSSVALIKHAHGKWHLIDHWDNSLGMYDWVICAIPVQQATALLPSVLTFYPEITAIKMKGCFSLMLGFQSPLRLDFDAAMVRGQDISWISVNSSKPGRKQYFCLLVHSTNAWADEHINDNLDEVMDYLCYQTSHVIGYNVNKADHKAIHGWHYANIEKQTGKSYFVDKKRQIAVCGDWFIQGRVEAAFTSGFDMANQILMDIKLAGEKYG